MNKRVLLTGGAGFIGLHMVDWIMQHTDWHLIVVDGITYAGQPERLANIRGVDPKRIDVVWHDLRAAFPEGLSAKIGKVDAIINCASDSHVDRSIEAPREFINNNVLLAVNMLELAREKKPEVFVQISTDEVYGPAPGTHSHKEWEPHIPSNPYAASKSAQEAIAISYWRTFNVPVVITNTLNNFGEWQHHEKFVPLCVECAITGRPLYLHGAFDESGKFVPGSRVWLHAKNHASAVVHIVNRAFQGKINTFPRDDRPSKWHIAGTKETDNLEVAKMIEVILDKKINIVQTDFHSSRPGHDLRYSLDTSALQATGWEPPIGFVDSFRDTILWHQKSIEKNLGSAS